MKCKGAIFDMDGVLFDTERLYQKTWGELAAEYGVSLGNRFVMEISGTNGERMKRVVEKYYHVSNGSVVIEACMERMKEKLDLHVPVKKGVYEILEYFRRLGMPIAVASSSSVQQIESNLFKSSTRGYFSEIVSGSEVKSGKPSPDIFLLAAKKIGCKAEECFVFEDSENGVRAGYSAGCFTIMVPDLIKPSEEIRFICSKICPDLLQARDEIEEMLRKGFITN